MKNSKWIWTKGEVIGDMYGEFADKFNYCGGKVTVNVSADSNYALYVNGRIADSGQYADYPYHKVYDELDITNLCRKGENNLSFVVWYYGKNVPWMVYYSGEAALKYEVYEDENVVAASDENTLSRVSPAYKNGYNKMLTGSIGCSFLYDMNKEDAWMEGDLKGFDNSVIVEQDLPMFPRPNKKYLMGEKIETAEIESDGKTRWLLDLGRESVGYIAIDVETEEEQTLTVAYGEHLTNNKVMRYNGKQDYTVEIVLKKGRNVYENYFRRLGGRYLEVFSEKPLKINYVTLIPTDYPTVRKPYKATNDLRQKIYDVSVRTLEICMHEHYEDTPWREQALYTLDSRNQMLFGYFAFDTFEFPRSNHELIALDNREDNLLSICYPIQRDQTIPSFSLYWFVSMNEYIKYSGDLSLAKQYMGKLKSLLKVFTDKVENGLIPIFTAAPHWNFYEWSKNLNGVIGVEEEKRFDLILNCLLVISLKNFEEICEAVGEKVDYSELKATLNRRIREEFFVEADGLFKNSTIDSDYSELGNSMAILCGAAGDDAENIANILADDNNSLTKITLSMQVFRYDALLSIDKAKYKDYILNDIDKRYKRMLDMGATSFWETEDADKALGNSRSHGWAAVPVYYYNILDK